MHYAFQTYDHVLRFMKALIKISWKQRDGKCRENGSESRARAGGGGRLRASPEHAFTLAGRRHSLHAPHTTESRKGLSSRSAIRKRNCTMRFYLMQCFKFVRAMVRVMRPLSSGAITSPRPATFHYPILISLFTACNLLTAASCLEILDAYLSSVTACCLFRWIRFVGFLYSVFLIHEWLSVISNINNKLHFLIGT